MLNSACSGFFACFAMRSAVLAMIRVCVCPYVRLSITRLYFVKTTQARITKSLLSLHEKLCARGFVKKF